jgi:hypothetical protein
MKYRGIEYIIKSQGKEWTWSVLPPDDKPIEGTVKGIKFRAMIAAEMAIDQWLKDHPEGS